MKTSSAGIALIEKWEQFRAEPYRDTCGVFTQGFGHTRTVTANSQAITIKKARELLMQDIDIVEHYINSNFKLRQCQFDALVSLLFNIGTGKFSRTKLFKLLKENPDSKYISDEWIEFRNAGEKYLRGLLRRRLDELQLYYSW